MSAKTSPRRAAARYARKIEQVTGCVAPGTPARQTLATFGILTGRTAAN